MLLLLLAGEFHVPEIETERALDLESDENDFASIPDFHIGERRGPPQFSDHGEDQKPEVLEWCLKKDVVWAILDALPGKSQDAEYIGSWTAFNKAVTGVDVKKSLLEYLPVIPQPPEYPVCKSFLDMLLSLMKELDVGHIFAHSDEQVYARLCHIIWKYPDVYKNVILLMGGFHQLRVRQRMIHKRHDCKGYKSWWIDAGVIAAGSADKAAEGGHYYRNMRLHKESFTALVQMRIEELTANYSTIEPNLLHLLNQLRSCPSSDVLKNVLLNKDFNELFKEATTPASGTESKMTIEYLKDVSALFALVSAVREKDFERHMQAERDMLKHCFAFDHINYARYLSFQHVYLRNLERDDHPSIMDLKARGLGGSLSGEKFSNIHGDLITEVFNGETKKKRGTI